MKWYWWAALAGVFVLLGIYVLARDMLSAAKAAKVVAKSSSAPDAGNTGTLTTYQSLADSTAMRELVPKQPVSGSVQGTPAAAVSSAQRVTIEGHPYSPNAFATFGGGQFSTLAGARAAADLAASHQPGKTWYVYLLPQGTYDVAPSQLDAQAGGVQKYKVG